MLNIKFMESRTDLGSVYSSKSFLPQEKCGIFAVYGYSGPENAAFIAYLGLLALQHRGQESAGMAYIKNRGVEAIKGMGLVDRVFSQPVLAGIDSRTILGHVRYSTTGLSYAANAQPLLARAADKKAVAVAHNGNLTNTRRLHNRLLEEGHIFHSTSDTEIILSYLSRFRKHSLDGAVQKTMEIIEGAYAAVVLDENQIIAFRDPNGFRPLVIGRVGGAYIFASETAALDAVGAVFLRDVAPGEIVSAGPGGLSSKQNFSQIQKTEHFKAASLCMFEYIYFSRPDSVLEGKSVYETRKKVGSLLAGHVPSELDLVIPSPDSGVAAAIGLADKLRLPLQWAVHCNPYLGRTFIEPTQGEREMAVRLKLNPVKELVAGKKVAIVDDSLVRGTTARVLVSLLREAGALEVHLCIASPPYRFPCYYGIDIPLAADLAAEQGIKGLTGATGADSVNFARLEDLYAAIGKEEGSLCAACFSGNYPTLNKMRGMVS
ncbi:MAG: amidophosphoribosyltransferase [Bacillota bacterium]